MTNKHSLSSPYQSTCEPLGEWKPRQYVSAHEEEAVFPLRLFVPEHVSDDEADVISASTEAKVFRCP